jgi:hypothetical protein
MPKPRQYTRELLTARAESLEAFRAGRGPLVRVVAGCGPNPYPVQYAPRTVTDPRPWVEWSVHTGQEVWRHTGRECWTVAAGEHDGRGWEVERPVCARLAHLGVAMVQESVRGREEWSALSYVFADGSAVRVTGEDVHGRAVSMRHTVGEHGAFAWEWHAADGMHEKRGRVTPGPMGPNFGRDADTLVGMVVYLADKHGRAWQEGAAEPLNEAARAWGERTGAALPFPPVAAL